MLIRTFILLVLTFTQYSNTFWGSHNSHSSKCTQDNAGMHDFNSKALEEFIISQSSLNQQDICGNTAIMYAAALEDILRLKLLINAKANLNLQNSEGNTALHISILLNKQQAIKTLIEANANPNVQNNDGNTPLHLAVITKDLRLISYLIAHGAQAIKNHEGKTPSDLALSRNDLTITEVMENLNHMQAKATSAFYNAKVLLSTGLTGFGIYLLIYFSWRQVQAYNQKNIQIVRTGGYAIPGTGISSSRTNPQLTHPANVLSSAITDAVQPNPTPAVIASTLTTSVINDAQSHQTPTPSTALPIAGTTQPFNPIPNHQGGARKSWGERIGEQFIDSLFNGIGQGIALMSQRIVEKAKAGDPEAKEIMQLGGQLLNQVGLEDTLNIKKIS